MRGKKKEVCANLGLDNVRVESREGAVFLCGVLKVTIRAAMLFGGTRWFIG